VYDLLSYFNVFMDELLSYFKDILNGLLSCFNQKHLKLNGDIVYVLDGSNGS